MVQIIAELRKISGKQVRKMRNAGKIPAVVYGMGKDEAMLEIDAADFSKVFREAGESTLIELKIGAETRNVLIHDVALDPIKDKPIHIDFLEVRMDKKIKAKVPITYVGESLAIKEGGVLVKVLHEIEVEALPKNLPHEIKIDLSLLEKLEDRFSVGRLKLPEGVAAISGLDEIIALVETPREEVEVEEAPSLDTIEVQAKGKEKEGALEGDGEAASEEKAKK